DRPRGHRGAESRLLDDLVRVDGHAQGPADPRVAQRLLVDVDVVEDDPGVGVPRDGDARSALELRRALRGVERVLDLAGAERGQPGVLLGEDVAPTAVDIR